MVKKDSYGFNTYVAVRVGEIQTKTNIEDWYWLESALNIADWVTRPKSPADIGPNSNWQTGPDFLRLPEEEWPIVKAPLAMSLPELKKEVFTCEQVKEDVFDQFDLERYSKWELLLNTTSRILDLQNKYRKHHNADQLQTNTTLQIAEKMWIMKAQQSLHTRLSDNTLLKLCSRVDEGVILVGGRTERWNEATWNKQAFILLPSQHRISWLISEWVHRKGGHVGISATVSKIRTKFWILGIRKLIHAIIGKCVPCRLRLKTMNSQIMSPLPEERLQPSPPFYTTGVDYFGPFQVKGEVQKRTRGKCYGIIFTCFSSRAVHLDIAADYSTDAFLQALRRFTSIRGWPRKFHSDQGSQLVGASNELRQAIAGVDKSKLRKLCSEPNSEWHFSTADAPRMNGVTESHVKSVKRALDAAIGYQVLTFSQFVTVMFECAQLVNSRPIGRHPTNPDDGAYLSPNDLLLGRSSNAVPQGPFRNTSNTRMFFFLQELVETFWRKWTTTYFPCLVIQSKWHTARRDIQVKDVVLMKDTNLLRGEWKLARVTEILESKDGRVRKVMVSYKNNEDGAGYIPKPYVTVNRAVHNLVVLVPAEEQV